MRKWFGPRTEGLGKMEERPSCGIRVAKLNLRCPRSRSQRRDTSDADKAKEWAVEDD